MLKKKKIDLEFEDFNSYLTDDGRSIRIFERSREALKGKAAFIGARRCGIVKIKCDQVA